MKKIVAAIPFIVLSALPAVAQSNPYDHYTSGYTTGRGTYVEPHYQTNPNGSTYDNYETRGNYNPHTGAYGSRSPY